MNRYAADLWKRAQEAIRTAETDLTVSFDAAASRAYYAAFYAVSALFSLEGREFSKHTAVCSAVHKDLVKNEAESVRHGSSLADALRRIPPFAMSLARWVQVGEASGGLDQLLESAGRRFQQQWDRFLSRLMALLEPALIVAISAFVLLVVLSILLPIMSLNASLL